MIRIPLRPLTQVFMARRYGARLDKLEKFNRTRRDLQIQARKRKSTELRLHLIVLIFFASFSVLTIRMAVLATTAPREPQLARFPEKLFFPRAEIRDRKGRILASNLSTQALYATPDRMVDPVNAAEELITIFPDMNKEALLRDLTNHNRKFIWLRKQISPEEQQKTHDIGEPGLKFAQRKMRLYPNGAVAAHILGGTQFGTASVQNAEIIGIAGIERHFNAVLNDPTRAGKALELSIDLSIQAILENVLQDSMRLMKAKAAAAVLLKVQTGEVLALASLPDFDPNKRQSYFKPGSKEESPLFNRAVQGAYDLGSPFKIFAAGLALDLGLADAQTMVDTSAPWKVRGVAIKDFRDYGPELSVRDVIVKSSNIGAGRLALQAGTENQKKQLVQFGFDAISPIELSEASQGEPRWPEHYNDVETVTISYGHGLSVSLLHLAAAYATIANDGVRVRPSLLKGGFPELNPERVMKSETAQELLKMLRAVVDDEEKGTASLADVPGYRVGGKTGSALKRNPAGGYYSDKLIASFTAVFPVDAPEYVLLVSLDEARVEALGEEFRTAGWTAAPVASELIIRIAPLLGLRPQGLALPSSQTILARLQREVRP